MGITMPMPTRLACNIAVWAWGTQGKWVGWLDLASGIQAGTKTVQI